MFADRIASPGELKMSGFFEWILGGAVLFFIFATVQNLTGADRTVLPRASRAKVDAPLSVEALVQKVKPAVVVITHFDRDGKEDGVGAGFVISSNGLIATSLHVIGEGRLFKVQFSDGRTYDASEVVAWDRNVDIAVVRVGATNLDTLALGDSDDLRQGA